MASIKFGGLVLVVIIISLALKYSSACAQEGIQRKAKRFTSISTENHESSQNMAKMGGRKVLVGIRNMQKGELLKRETEKKGESNLKQEISGNDASPKKSMDGAETSHKNNLQDNSNVYRRQERQKEYASKKNTAAYSPPKSTTSVVLSDHDHDHDHYHHRHRAHRHEKDNQNHDFLEAKDDDDDDDDVINLMRRDYRGTDRPRRKPPINNHEPSD